MKEPKQETVIRRYLLGELNEDDREQVEQRLITDRDYKEEVLIVEEELLEDYVSGTLPQRERDLFLRNYLSAPLQKQKLRITRALDKYASQTSVRTPKVVHAQGWVQRLIHSLRSHGLLMQLSWAVLLLVVLVGVWWIVRSRRSDDNGLQAELARLNGPESSVLEAGSTVATAVLLPLTLRETGRLPSVTLSDQTQVVQLRIAQLSGQPRTYQAVLKDGSGREVAKVSGVASRDVGNGRMIVLQFPARIFQPGDYVVTIGQLNSAGAVDDVGDYSFHVAR